MLHWNTCLLDKRAIVYQVLDKLCRFVDAESVEVSCGVSFLAAVSDCVVKSRKSAKVGLETGDNAFIPNIIMQNMWAAAFYFINPGIRVAAFQYSIFMGNNIISDIFRR